MLIDAINMDFPVTPILQEWVANEILSKYKEMKIKKTANVLPKDIFVAVSFQQIYSEDQNATYEVKHFDNKAEAISWLKK